jgi:hypothetical protein
MAVCLPRVERSSRSMRRQECSRLSFPSSRLAGREESKVVRSHPRWRISAAADLSCVRPPAAILPWRLSARRPERHPPACGQEQRFILPPLRRRVLSKISASYTHKSLIRQRKRAFRLSPPSETNPGTKAINPGGLGAKPPERSNQFELPTKTAHTHQDRKTLRIILTYNAPDIVAGRRNALYYVLYVLAGQR